MELSPSLDKLAVFLLKEQLSKLVGNDDADYWLEQMPEASSTQEILNVFRQTDAAVLEQKTDGVLREMIQRTPIADQLDRLASILPESLAPGSLQNGIGELFADVFPSYPPDVRTRAANSYFENLQLAFQRNAYEILLQVMDQSSEAQSSAADEKIKQLKAVLAPLVPHENERKERKASSKPGPVVPVEQASFILPASSIRVSVALLDNGWRVDGMDALVISTDPSGKVPAGQFYHAFLQDMPRNTRDLIHDALVTAIAKDGTASKKEEAKVVAFNTFLAVQLPTKLQERVFPFSADKSGHIILTNDQRDDGTPTFLFSATAAVGAISRAATSGRRHVILPVIGGAGMTEEERGEVLELVLKKLKTLSYQEPRTLQNITIVTTSPTVLTRARRLFNLLNNNRAQPFKNDQAMGEDLLGITEEINALADTLLLREVRPPLAVGIMGGWGSGKSFVMHLIQKRMGEIRSRAIQRASDNGGRETNTSPFVGHVYRINFNAWTYAKSNLWASLMQTIFFELNRQLSYEQESHGDPLAEDLAFREIYDTGESNLLWQIMGERKTKAMEQLRLGEQQLAQAKIDKEQAILKRQKDVDKLLGEQVPSGALSLLNQKIVESVRESLSDSAKEVLRQQDVTEAEVEKVISSLQSTSATVRNLYKELARHPLVAVSLILFMLVSLWGIPYLADLLKWQAYQDWMRWLISLVPILLPALNLISAWSRRVDEMVKEFQNQSETERANWQSRKEALLAERKAQDEAIVAKELQEAKPEDVPTDILKGLANVGNLAASERLLKEKETEVEEKRRRIGPTAQYISLLEFVHSRLDGASYESQLGLMHQVKRDIDELNSGLIVRAGEGPEEKKAKEKLFPRGEPRIVLFIDDLDRCPPPRVVQVLEAVQLLLNTELFVVIIALDTRYVTRALEKEYKEILQHEGDPSGLDYIEKIIQIPYRIRPVSEAGLPNYLKAQMDILPAPALAPKATPPPQASPRGRKPKGKKEITPEPVTTNPAEPNVGQPVTPPATPAADQPVDLPPEVVKFQQEDLEDLVTCCQQVDLTPRSIKRLVNVFKLIEIYWFRASGENRSREVKSAVMGLLALSAAYPEIMREAFVRIDMGFRTEELRKKLVFDTLSEFELESAERSLFGLKWQFFKRDVEALKSKKFGNVSLAQFEFSTFNLVRSFSFVGDPSYWGDTSPANRQSVL